MNIVELMRDAFSLCEVKDGKISFLRAYSEEEHKAIYERFMSDLLDWKIPHYRVVGVKFMRDGFNNSMIGHQYAYNCSFLDIINESSYIIPYKIEGNDIDDACFVEKGTAHNNKQWVEGNGGHVDILRFPTAECGQLMFKTVIGNTEYNSGPGFLDAGNDFLKIQTDMDIKNMHVVQWSLMETLRHPRCLIPEHHFTTVEPNSLKSHVTYFFYKKGTGVSSFDRNAKLFTPDSGVTPCMTKYDLSEFIICRFPMANDPKDCLQIMYKTNIDEYVLTRILNDYGKEYSES